jgi:hypothetical protein
VAVAPPAITGVGVLVGPSMGEMGLVSTVLTQANGNRKETTSKLRVRNVFIGSFLNPLRKSQIRISLHPREEF